MKHVFSSTETPTATLERIFGLIGQPDKPADLTEADLGWVYSEAQDKGLIAAEDTGAALELELAAFGG